MNLWTVGCADPRLTAPARSPMDKPGKTLCVSPTLPTGRRLPTSFTAPGYKTDEFDFGERGNQQPATSLSLIPPRNPSKQPVPSHFHTARRTPRNHNGLVSPRNLEAKFSDSQRTS